MFEQLTHPTAGESVYYAATALGVLFLFWLLVHVVASAVRRWHLRSIPHAPSSLPVLRHLHNLAFDRAPWSVMSSWIESTSEMMITWGLPLQDFVMVRGGEAMKTVFQTRFKDWHKDVGLSFHPFLCILGSGLVTSEGELWQKQRKLMTPAFKGDILQEVIEIGLRAVSRLMKKLDELKEADTVEIEEEFRLLTLQVITEAVLSLHHEESDHVFPKLYLPIMEECHLRVLGRWREYLPIMPAWWGHWSRCRRLDAYINNLLRKRWQSLDKISSEAEASGSVPPPPQDMLDVILMGKRRAGEGWSTSLETQLCYELKTFLLAGHETSASMLTLTLLEVLSAPEIEGRILQEAAAVLGPPQSEKVPSKGDVEAGMPYTAACLQETLRKYSIVPVLVRTAVRDTQLLGHYIPAGTKCSIMVSSTHRLWKDPETYRPERFLPGGEFDSFPEDVRRFMFVPFGQGPRVCIGQHFSLMESRVVLAKLLQRYRCTLQRPYELEWRPNLIPSQPVGGVPITVEKRR